MQRMRRAGWRGVRFKGGVMVGWRSGVSGGVLLSRLGEGR